MNQPKKRFSHCLTRGQILRLAPLLFCATASASPVLVNEANMTNVWTLPTGANLLNGAAAINPTAPANADHGNGDITSASWTTLTDAVLGDPANRGISVAPLNNTQVTFPLDVSTNFNGYVITQFDSYCAWQDNGRVNQNFSVEYSKVSDPETFLPLVTIANNGGSNKATHTQVTDSTGVLATNVHSLRFIFANQQNGYVGYREFILQGTPVPTANPLTWTGASGTGGNANWTTAADSNWKITGSSNTVAAFNSISNLTFDTSGANRTISIPSSLTTASMAFSNGSAAPYVFSGAGTVTVAGDVTATNSGAVTFNNPFIASSELKANGSGALTFGGAFQAKSLAMAGGNVKFTAASPVVGSLSGFDGSLVLGNTSPVVNTVLTVGDGTSTQYDGSISNASGAKGGLTKVGTGRLTLNGANSNTGVTTVSAGELEFTYSGALYGGNSTLWTAANLIVAPSAAFIIRVGGDEFTTADYQAINRGGFQAGSLFGFSTANGDYTLPAAFTGSTGLLKIGSYSLNLENTNTHTGLTKVTGGAINAANPSGISIPGNVQIGDGSAEAFLHFGQNNQTAASTVLTFANGVANSKVQLRGTSQTVAGLDSPITNDRSIIQTDESATPGFTELVTTASELTIHATTDHSFAGLIRNGGTGAGSLGIIKTGPAMQEFINVPAQGYSFNGGLFIDEGTVKLNFTGGNTGFGSQVIVASGAKFALDGAFDYGMQVNGDGKVVKQGAGAVRIVTSGHLYTGGTDVEAGNLVLYSNGSAGQGTGPGDHCNIGLMDPSNVVTVKSGATLTLENIAPLGNSALLPEYAPSVVIESGGKLSGGNDTVAFVANLTLNGGTVDITKGANHGGFGTNLALIGTIKVGGTTPSTISTSGTAATSNVSLGNQPTPEATFQVADVTGNANDDLIVSSVLRDIQGHVSSLKKTGAGTMHLSGVNTYTGTTTVSEGTLTMDQACLADGAGVSIGANAFLALPHGQADTVASLTIDGVPMAAGTYVATTNNASGAIKTARITGTGSLVVGGGSSGGGYDAWSAVITDSTKRGRDADPDGDGFTNLQEYLFGTSPVAVSGSLITTEKTGGNLVVRWNQLSTGTSTYVVQESTDLVNWITSTTATIANDPTQTSSSYTLKQATVPVSGTRKFIRVQATE